jgi:hypothetical protein
MLPVFLIPLVLLHFVRKWPPFMLLLIDWMPSHASKWLGVVCLRRELQNGVRNNAL